MERESDRRFGPFAIVALLIASTLTAIWVGVIGWGLMRAIGLFMH